ncbi:hypothetical protein BAVI_21178 [Neobacillus vireti LMG 21834]|uniref:Heterocycloanthracin/sonorensin family bacteriocin n=3 Tax=Neobacillus TaxID=2675232 RepID=A0AB94II78_9BACI|nr:hypothetical protein BAVI_21178 [Neobacillus vireti LMG 21834]KLT15829.1 hypothetical protein AA980_21730 [Neobacillus vireti]
MHNFHNELQGLGMDPYLTGQVVPFGQQIQDTRVWGRCGGFRCGGFRCGGCFGCGGCGFGCGGCFGGFGCFGIGFGFI